MITAEHDAKMSHLIDVTAVCAHAVRFITYIGDNDQESVAAHIAALLEGIQNDAWDIAAEIEKTARDNSGGAA